MTQASVAVVIVNWNGWHDTIRCLTSLNISRVPPSQILVIDNASSDDSVQKIRTHFPNQKIIVNSNNLGFGGGCNVGIRFAFQNKPDYIWLLNNDATIESETLGSLVAAAVADPLLGAAGSIIYEAGDREKIQLWGGGKINFWLGRSRLYKSPTQLDFVSGASMLLRTQALESVGLFDEESYFMYWEDTDLCFRLRKKNWRIATASRSHVWHRGSGSLGRHSSQADEYFVRSAVRFFRKHAPWPRLAITTFIISLLAKRFLLFRINNIFSVLQGWRTA